MIQRDGCKNTCCPYRLFPALRSVRMKPFFFRDDHVAVLTWARRQGFGARRAKSDLDGNVKGFTLSSRK